MEQEYYSENGLDGMTKEELLAGAQSRCVALAKYYRRYSILWLVTIIFALAVAFFGMAIDWVVVGLALAAGLLCLLGVARYKKLSKCGDADQFLYTFKRTGFYRAINAFPGFFIGWFLGNLIWGSYYESCGLAVYVASIVLLIILVISVIIIASKENVIRDNYIKPLRELKKSENSSE